jgi:arylsulfatase
MKTKLMLGVTGVAVVLVLAAAAAESAQTGTIHGEPGAPSATITIDGKQLPPPPDKNFGGRIERNAIDSTPYWPPRVVPPEGAPNILLIMTDDAGYGVAGTFGGVIPTPAMDRIADNGLRYTHFHSTAVCSPTRAALLTGRNHHQVGTGSIPELSTGYDQRQCNHRQNPQGPWLRDLLVWQEPQYAGSPGQQDRAL